MAADRLAKRIHDALIGRTELVALVGPRIYYGVPAQGVSQPQVSFLITRDMTIGSLDGELSTDLRDATIEINAWSPDNVVAQQVATEVLIALDNAVTFACQSFDSREDFDQLDKTYNVEIDATLWWYPGRQ